MKTRPVLFSSPMVRALLDGRKTQTRRIVKFPGDAGFDGFSDAGVRCSGPNQPTGTTLVACPYGKPGDRLWVREAWLERRDHVAGIVDHNAVRYAADGEPPEPFRWRGRPSIHMPRWASRITLEVTGVRVERLTTISEADAMAEGVEFDVDEGAYRVDGMKLPPPNTPGAAMIGFASARRAFGRLWESINGEGSWSANPWVWVISFARVES